MDKYITQKMPTGTVIAQTVGITASLFLLGMSSPDHLHLHALLFVYDCAVDMLL